MNLLDKLAYAIVSVLTVGGVALIIFEMIKSPRMIPGVVISLIITILIGWSVERLSKSQPKNNGG